MGLGVMRVKITFGFFWQAPTPVRSYMGLGRMNIFGVNGARENNATCFWQAPMPIRTYMGLGGKK